MGATEPRPFGTLWAWEIMLGLCAGVGRWSVVAEARMLGYNLLPLPSPTACRVSMQTLHILQSHYPGK